MKLVGEYVLLKEGDKTPLGKLLLAEHKILKRRAALKQISFGMNGEERLRLEENIASLGLLEHPHLARLQNVSIQEDSCYFAYDWLSSSDLPCMNLREYASSKDLSEEEIELIALQIASALDKVHEASLCHLGVKLSNVLVDTREDKMMCYLTDTGLTHLVPPQVFLLRLLEACTKRMEYSSFWESFHALSPEQKEGEISNKADVYAFGVLLYFLLCRKFPQGRFLLPSEVGRSARWDGLICAYLDPIAEKRPIGLVASLSRVGEVKDGGARLQLRPREIHRPQFDVDPGSIFQNEHVIMRYQPKEQEIKQIDPIETPMAIITGGSFFRGSLHGARDETPRHKISLSSFAMDKYPVTNEQFVLFLEAMGGEKDGNNNDMIRLRDSRIRRSAGKITIESGYAKHPVVGVSWYGAVAYAKWVGKRLPTEAEWEIAALGGMETMFPTGQDISRTQANFFSSDTTAVMSYAPNAYGLYDMAGNVYEWCRDWYDYQYYDISLQEPTDPAGPPQGVYRVLRGGCWKSSKEDLRCAHRHRNNPGAMTGTYGFRCAVDVEGMAT